MPTEYEDVMIRLPKGLIEAVKDEAAHSRTDVKPTISSLIEEALRGWFLL